MRKIEVSTPGKIHLLGEHAMRQLQSRVILSFHNNKNILQDIANSFKLPFYDIDLGVEGIMTNQN